MDVEYGLLLKGRRIDIAVATERDRKRLRVYRISPDTGLLTDVSSDRLQVFEGETGEKSAPMGVGLYRRPSDGTIFAIVSRKEGPLKNYLWQYKLIDDGKGKVKAVKVREFGRFSGVKEIESVAVDDAAGYVYYSDETRGVRKYYADPDKPGADKELAFFATSGYTGDHEGIAVYAKQNGKGYIICTDQIKGKSRYNLYDRRSTPSGTSPLKIISGADDTDGIEAASSPFGSRFPLGILVVMNSKDRNFLIYCWKDVEDRL